MRQWRLHHPLPIQVGCWRRVCEFERDLSEVGVTRLERDGYDFSLIPEEQETVEDWDSLNVLNVLMAIESEFGVTISPEEAASFVSVEKILAVLRTKGVSQS